MKYIKIYRTLMVALILGLLVAISPSKPALAQATLAYTPLTGHVGDTVYIYGAGYTFPGVYFITFNSATFSQAIGSGSVLASGTISTSFDVPEAPQGDYAIWVQTAMESASGVFRIDSQISLSESTGFVGDEFKVSGTGFAASKSVTIYLDGEEVGNTVTNIVGSFTDATFAVPESYQGSHTLEVKDASNNSDTAIFSTKQSMSIDSVSGTVGSELTVSGTGFKADENMTITFDDVAVIPSPVSVTTNTKGSFNATIVIPNGATGTHKVEASDGTNKDSQVFTILAVASISQAAGYVGDEVTYSGSGFVANQPVTITFDNENVATGTTDNFGNLNASFTVPTRGAGTYRVKVSDGTNTFEADFSISTSADITPKTSAAFPGHVGTEVTISGIGFMAGATVTVTYDGKRITTAPVNTDGTFSATFQAPAGSGGEYPIMATDGTNSTQFVFVMESISPPIPAPLKPEMDIEAEAVVSFDWVDVTDDSLPVTYTLQIATDNTFSSIVLEKGGLAQSGYTLTEEEQLEAAGEEAPYYWRVKATDGASNESQWSGTGSFYVRATFSMPQPVIYTLFGVGALLLGVLGFWLGRKTAYVG